MNSFCKTTLLSLILLSSVKLVAQIDKSEQVQLVKNNKTYSSNLIINGAELDKRIAKYYSEEDILNFTSKKIHQLNYLYLETYTVLDRDALNSATKKYIDENFDAGLYDHLRMQKERAKVKVEQNGYKFEIELFSREEIIKYKNTIKE